MAKSTRATATKEELMERLEGYQDLLNEVFVLLTHIRAQGGCEDRLERALEKASPGSLDQLESICRPRPRTELTHPALKAIAKRIAA